VEVLKALREVQVHQEMEEIRAQLAQKAHKELLVREVIQARQELVGHKVQQEQKVQLVQQAILDQ
jgi:hypothetical protein